jgi:LPS O-antigen subunit length determinant protein (WzzB/FepE family)
MVWSLAEHRGWKQVVLPFLVNKLNQSFPDPSEFKKEDEFTYAAKTASVFKKVIAELLQWVDNKVEEAKFYEKKEKGEIKDTFNIGGDE